MKLQILWQNLNISAITPVDLDATTSVAQTLTCIIGDVTKSVEVKWRYRDGDDITNNQDGYTMTKGSVSKKDTKNLQESTLIISPETLQKLHASSFFVTYQCSAQSSEYPESEASPYQNLLVTFHDFGEYNLSTSHKQILWSSDKPKKNTK